MVAAEGGNFRLAPWDWRHYAERRRKAEFDFDEAKLKPYLQLDNVIAAAFDVAGRLFGLAFEELKGLPLYRPDVRVWRVTAQRRPLRRPLPRRLLRPRLQAQRRLDERAPRPAQARRRRPADRPQHHELRKGAGGQADADLVRRRAHAVPRVRPCAARPAVGRDLSARSPAPAWRATSSSCPRSSTSIGWSSRRCCAASPSTPRPARRCRRRCWRRCSRRARFNQGFATVEYTSSALVDLDLHLLSEADDIDVVDFETRGAGSASACRRRWSCVTARRISSTSSPATATPSGYYSYLWSEVLDADAFEAFAETGDIFDPGHRQAPARPRLFGRLPARPGRGLCWLSAAGCLRPRRCSRKRGLAD